MFDGAKDMVFDIAYYTHVCFKVFSKLNMVGFFLGVLLTPISTQLPSFKNSFHNHYNMVIIIPNILKYP